MPTKPDKMPEWATEDSLIDGEPNVIEPSPSRKEAGWDDGIPSAQEQNWWQRTVHRFVEWLTSTLEDHIGNQSTAHGSTSLPTAGRIMRRKSDGRGGEVEDPTQPKDPVNAQFLTGSLVTSTTITQQLYLSAGTYTWLRPDGCRYILLETVGGGGAGGGAESGVPISVGGGGSSGAYGRTLLDVTDIASADITVGAGGDGNPAATGSAGGTTRFENAAAGVLYRSRGGTGGATSTETNPAAQGGGSAAPDGDHDLDVHCTAGHHGWGAGTAWGAGGTGGNSVIGAVSRGLLLREPQQGGLTGGVGRVGGGGGGSVAREGLFGDVSGGTGGDGAVIITEFYGTPPTS